MSCCGDAAAGRQTLDLPAQMRERAREDDLRRASSEPSPGRLQTVWVVPDMHCIACIRSIEKAVGALAHVEAVRANLSRRLVSVTWRTDEGSALAIDHALDALGFAHTVFEPGDGSSAAVEARGRQLLLCLAVAGFASANIMLLSVSVWSGAVEETARLFHLISALIAVPAVAYAGRPFFTSALTALSARRLNMDVPISLAVILALAMSIFETLAGDGDAYFDAAVTLLFFLLIGRYLDHLMRIKARAAVDRLARLAAKSALVLGEDGETTVVPVTEVLAGARLRVLPGERVPVDGVVIDGASDIDRSLVTGESEPVVIAKDGRLEAGVLNLTGVIDMVATADADHSFLAEINRMMAAAERGRSAYIRVADRMAQIYAPAVHLLALVTFIGWTIVGGGDWVNALTIAIAVLIITCPCALGLAVPVAHVVAANRLFADGILMRDGAAIERLARIDAVVFDKTGTLTLGQPKVSELEGELPAKWRPVLRALASRSSHPAAKAIADFLQPGPQAELDAINEKPGFGVEARYQGKRVRLGRPGWVGAPQLTGVTFRFGDGDSVGFKLADVMRPGARETVGALKAGGVKVELVSGDHGDAVAAAAAEADVGTFIAGATPAQKIERIHALQHDGRNVLMVGDGLNDGPALTAADVSMAPAAASDVGRMAADFVLVRPDLTGVARAHETALQTGRVVRQNFAIALIYNCIAVPMAMAGGVTPLIAAIAMSASSVLVIANSLRLNWRGGLPETVDFRSAEAAAVAVPARLEAAR